MILKKVGGNERRRFLLCWHSMSVAGSTDSLKPHALRVPSCRRAGLDRIRSASSKVTCASQAKKAKELPLFCSLGMRGIQQQLFRRDHRTWMEELFHPPGKRAG